MARPCSRTVVRLRAASPVHSEPRPVGASVHSSLPNPCPPGPLVPRCRLPGLLQQLPLHRQLRLVCCRLHEGWHAPGWDRVGAVRFVPGCGRGPCCPGWGKGGGRGLWDTVLAVDAGLAAAGLEARRASAPHLLVPCVHLYPTRPPLPPGPVQTLRTATPPPSCKGCGTSGARMAHCACSPRCGRPGWLLSLAHTALGMLSPRFRSGRGASAEAHAAPDVPCRRGLASQHALWLPAPPAGGL